MALPDISLLAEMGVLTKPMPRKQMPEAERKAIRVIKTRQWRKDNPEKYLDYRKQQNRKAKARQRAWSPERRAKEAKRIRAWQIANREHLREYRNQWNKRKHA